MPSPARRIVLVVAAALAAAYGLAGFLVAPGLVRGALLDGMGKALVARPDLARVRVNPFALSLTLEGLRVRDAAGDSVAGFDRLYLRFDPLGSIFSRAWTLARLEITRPSVTLEVLPDRTLNMMRLVRPRPAAADSGSGAPAWRIGRFTLADGSLRFADRSRVPAFGKSLGPIRLELTDFGNLDRSRNASAFEARTALGETLSWRGRFTMQPFRSEGELRAGALRAKTLADLLGEGSPFVIAGGTFTLASRYMLDAAATPADMRLTDLALDVREAALADRASGDTAITVRALVSEGGAYDLVRSALELGRVRVDGAHVRAAMLPDGQLDLARWAAPAAAAAGVADATAPRASGVAATPAPAAGAAAPADSAPPLVTSIASATVRGLEFEFEDRRLEPPAVIGLRGATAEIAGFSTAPDSAFALTLACSLGARGHATAKGRVVPSAPSADLALEVRGFDLAALEPYVQAFARIRLAGGAADAKGRLLFNRFGAKGPLVRFTGDARSSGFAAVDHKLGTELLAWKTLVLEGLEYDALPGRIALRNVNATQPYVRMVVAPDQTTNFQATQVPPDSVPAAFRPAAGAAPDTMPVRIGRVKVVDGSMYFADLSLTPSFATGVQQMNGEITGLSSAQAASAEIRIEGKVDAYAPARISGTVNPLNGRARTDVAVTFENIELTTFTPYSGKFMGYRIEKGKLDLDLRYRIENRQLDATNKVFVRQLTLGDKVESPDATKLPVKFAIALLKNREGNIDLNLPVKGNLDDPKFSVMPIVMKVLVGLVTKAVASPFALLGAVFGGDEPAAPDVTFGFGSAELDTAAVRKLEVVRQGLADRPNLRLEIEEPGEVAADSLALFARGYAALLGAAAGAPVTPPPAQVEAAKLLAPAGFTPERWAAQLTRAYVARHGRVPGLEGEVRRAPRGAPPDPSEVAAEARRLRFMDDRVKAAVRVDAAELHGLPRARAQHVQGVLLAGGAIAPERVFITSRARPAVTDSAGVRVELKLAE